MAKMDDDFVRACATACRRPAAWASASTAWSMLLTNTQTIRDVILFPLLRPERVAK